MEEGSCKDSEKVDNAETWLRCQDTKVNYDLNHNPDDFDW
jgi:hypothetical protein